MVGTVGILNVGAGDIRLTFDKSNAVECIRAARIVNDMLRRGYALLVEVEPGKYQRAHDFDEAALAYVIADYDPTAQTDYDRDPWAPAIRRVAEIATNQENNGEQAEKYEAPATESDAAPKRKAGRTTKRLVPADKARAVSVGRTAGG